MLRNCYGISHERTKNSAVFDVREKLRNEVEHGDSLLNVDPLCFLGSVAELGLELGGFCFGSAEGSALDSGS